MTPALRNAAAMRRGQFAYESGTPPEPDDAREEAADRIGDAIDNGDPQTVKALADYVYEVGDHEILADITAGVLEIKSWQWDFLRSSIGQINEKLADALQALRDDVDKHRKAFIDGQLKGDQA
ncbi:hypothetical protein D3C78_511600 [compost metagenome]